jgi:hypothetical protein
MAAADLLCAHVGYELRVLALLPESERERVLGLGKWYILPCVLLAVALGCLGWLVEHSVALSVGLGASMALFVWNLLRLLVSGGGAAPHTSEAEAKNWAPTLAPLLVFGLLGACLAQPVQLLLPYTAQDDTLEQLRQELVQRHERAASRSLHAGAAEQSASVTSPAAYRAQVARCAFVAQRLRHLWRTPEMPLAFTLLFCAFALAPLLLGHTTHLRALRAYELARWRNVRDWVRDQERDTQREVNELLGGFAHFAPGALPKLNAPPARGRSTQPKVPA